MRTAPRRTCSALVAAALFVASSHALAQTPDADDEAPEPAPEPGAGIARPPAPDLRRGAILVTAGASLLAPLGTPFPGVDITNLLGPGLGLKGAVGLGLSRHVSLELAGSYGLLPGSESCSACSGRSFDVGFGIMYHLAQGIAFDPWARIGVGYRTMTIDAPGIGASAGAGSYEGLDFAKIALGGTYYPTSFFGFGPYFEASFGSFRVLPDPRANPGVYSFLDFGLRVTFDPLRPGKLSAASKR